MIPIKKTFVLVFLFITTYGCKTEKKQDAIKQDFKEVNTNTQTEQYKPKPINNNIGSIISNAIKEATKTTRRVKIDSVLNDLMRIKEKSFYTISPGDSFSIYKKVLKKELLKTRKGDFETYTLYDENNIKLATVNLDPEKKELIGTVNVVNNKAKTKDGISVGMTFGDLLYKYPNIEVHGSEIEDRTYARHGNLSYQLEMSFSTQEVDRSKVNRTVKIKAIVINK